MVFGGVERGEIVEVVLDLGALGNGEAERVEERLDAVDRTGDRVKPAHAGAAPRQRDVERFRGELSFKLRLGKLVAATAKCRLELGLGLIDARPGGGALRGGEFA